MARELTVITGGAGLLGNGVARQLLSAGHEVLAADLVAGDIDGVPVMACDLRSDDQVSALVADATTVIHCGGYSGAMVGANDPYALLDVNVMGTARLLERGCRASLRRFVYLSSATAYGPTPDVIVDEDRALEPASPYGASKAASEALVRSYAHQYDLDAVSLRLSWVYGPRRTTACLVRDMLLAGLTRTPLTLSYGADFPRQYMYVTDAIQAICAAHDLPGRLPRRVYNVSGGDWRTLAEVATAVEGVFPEARISLADGPDPLDIVQGRLDIGAFAADTGFSPTQTFDSGIRLYASWLSEHLDLLSTSPVVVVDDAFEGAQRCPGLPSSVLAPPVVSLGSHWSRPGMWSPSTPIGTRSRG